MPVAIEIFKIENQFKSPQVVGATDGTGRTENTRTENPRENSRTQDSKRTLSLRNLRRTLH